MSSAALAIPSGSIEMIPLLDPVSGTGLT